MNLTPEITLQIVVVLFTGLNAWLQAKTAATVNDLKALMYKEFVTKEDFERHSKGSKLA